LVKRPDGTLLKDLSFFRRLNPLIMRNRTESTIFIPLKVDVTNTLKYVAKLSKERNEKVSIFNIILMATARTFAMRPQLNRFVVGHNIYQRNEILMSTVVKKQLNETAEETSMKLSFQPHDTLFTSLDRIKKELTITRTDKGNEGDQELQGYAKWPFWLFKFILKVFRWLDRHNLAPASMLRTDPLYTSCYITNVGSIKLGAPYHHLYSWGTASLFLGVGEYYKDYVVNKEGQPEIRDIMDIIVSYDDRISEGIYGARAAQLLKSYIESPEELEHVPNIPPEIISELQLKSHDT